MEPARLRVILARTPGLLSAHLFACVIDGQSAKRRVPVDLLACLLHSHLPVRSRVWLEFTDNGRVDADLRWCEANDCQILLCLDADFPAGFARASVSITSGLAGGIDTAAHGGALAAGGRCIGVWATGPDRAYPACSARLAAWIRAQGTLLSVFPPGTPARRHHFPLRNRLISALTASSPVVEAAAGSGSLTAVHQARLLGKPVFAVPGSIRDLQARGRNPLSRDGATLVQQPSEIWRDLCVKYNNQKVTRSATARAKLGSGPSPLDNKYEMLLDAAGFEPVDIDVLAFRTGWSGHTVASMLLMLELQGRVAPQPGGRYCRLS